MKNKTKAIANAVHQQIMKEKKSSVEILRNNNQPRSIPSEKFYMILHL
ncbi:hypothetical protein [Spirulina sp. 06S082]|nr:hypothetical protein [Spirulina sp. 06S082]MEA5472014.1 hypothetical protein [Spirulina sp. 06S082]